MKILKCTLLLAFTWFANVASAQFLLPEEDLPYIYNYGPEELYSADLDSVFGYFEYGNNWEGSEEIDSTPVNELLLKCKNLQVLELHNVYAVEFLNHLEEFPNLQILVLDNVSISQLPAGFKSLQYLKKLNLAGFSELYFDPSSMQGNSINSLEIRNCTSVSDEGPISLQLDLFPELTSLTLSGDYSLLPDNLYQCTKLTSLDVSGVGLKAISPDIGNLEALEMCYLNMNGDLGTLPEEFANLSNLRYLNMSSCNFEDVPEALAELTNVSNLDLSYNPLLELPDFIGNFVNLESLNLSGTGISTLPETFSDCGYLSSLSMSGCGLQEIPSVLFRMGSISDIDFSYNEIVEIPAEASGLAGLSYLDLGSNQIRGIKNGSLNFPNLYSLRLSDCPIKQLPNNLGNMPYLSSLDLSGDSLTSIPVGLFQHTSLYTLNLGSNQLTSIPEGISSLSNLYDLNLGNNQLTALPKDLIKLVNLQYLDFSSNKVAKLPKGISKMTTLNYIYAAGNKNIVLNKELKKIPNLYQISLNRDDLNDKAWAKLRTWLTEDKIYISDVYD